MTDLSGVEPMSAEFEMNDACPPEMMIVPEAGQ
jgi:hypothetical protein